VVGRDLLPLFFLLYSRSDLARKDRSRLLFLFCFAQIDRALDCLLQQQLQNSNLPRADLQNPIYKLQPIYSNLFDLTTARMMNNQQINLAVSNPVI
jgi:hypothetical protein